MKTKDTLPSKAVCNHDRLLSKPAGSGVLGGTVTYSAAAAGRGERAGGEAGTRPLQVPEKVCPRAIGVFEWINLADKVSHITPLKMLLPCSI